MLFYVAGVCQQVDVVEEAVDACRHRYIVPPPPLALGDGPDALASVATPPPLEFVLINRSDSALPFPREQQLCPLFPFARRARWAQHFVI